MVDKKFMWFDKKIIPNQIYSHEELKMMDIIGILTLENVLEVILNINILDEQDRDDVVSEIQKMKLEVSSKAKSVNIISEEDKSFKLRSRFDQCITEFEHMGVED